MKIYIILLLILVGVAVGFGAAYFIFKTERPEDYISDKESASYEFKPIEGEILDGKVVGNAREGMFVRVEGVVVHVVDKGGKPAIKLQGDILCALPVIYAGRVAEVVKIGSRVNFVGPVKQVTKVGVLVSPAVPYKGTRGLFD